MTAPEVLELISNMPREQRVHVLEFVLRHMGGSVLGMLSLRDLWRVQRYAEAIVKNTNK